MAKVSPNRNNFNAGVFSPLLEGRVDLDKYPASMRSLHNYVATPQGPAIPRSGTYFVTPAYNDAYLSTLVPFVYSEEEAFNLEFSNYRMRIIRENGLQAHPAALVVILDGDPLKIESAGLTSHGAVVGDHVAFAGFPVEYNLNGVVTTITAKSGNEYTVDMVYPGDLGVAGVAVSLIYEIPSPYTDVDARNIRARQSIDVIYMFCDGYKPRKLSRYDTYDWRWEEFDFNTGPFMPVDPKNGILNPFETGNPIPVMSSNALPAGYVASASTEEPGHEAYRAFDGNKLTYWQPEAGDPYDPDTETGGTGFQRGTLNITLPAPKLIKSYTIYYGNDNNEKDYMASDFAPGDFSFEGGNGGAFAILDVQVGYVLYEGTRSATFELKTNDTAYSEYRLVVTKCTRNGEVEPRIAALILGSGEEADTDFTMTLHGDYSKLNRGAGFLATDVGRYIRMKGSDSFWRIAKIMEVVTPTNVTVRLEGEPLPDLIDIREWQIAYFSDTTGYPRVGTFFDDRLWMGGNRDAPDLVTGSQTGAYEKFAQRTPTNEVLDDSAIVVRLNSRRLSKIMWLEDDEKGLLIGTGSREWVISATQADLGITARNIKARSSSARGSAFVEPVKVDRQVLYVQLARRTVREYVFVFEADGYKSPSMSLFSSHLGSIRFAEMAYTAEPHSILWLRRDNGTVVSLTYNRDENVIGWQTHDFDGFVESISSIPSAATNQDTLWMVVRRTINGVTKRYIEKLMRFWDFDSTISSAHYVDCGLRYVGPALTTLYGLQHLEGKPVVGLVDNIPFGPVTVTNGRITLPYEGTNIVVGMDFDSYGETSNIEAGAADGTAQGKTKRAHNCVVVLWNSAYGEIGRYNEDRDQYEYREVEYKENFDTMPVPALQSVITEPMDLPAGYGKRGSIAFRRTKPLPFNVIAILPQMFTQDR